MKKSINPLVGAGLVILAIVVIVTLLYRANTRPTSGSIESMTPEARASLYKALAPPKPAPGTAQGVARGPGTR